MLKINNYLRYPNIYYRHSQLYAFRTNYQFITKRHMKNPENRQDFTPPSNPLIIETVNEYLKIEI